MKKKNNSYEEKYVRIKPRCPSKTELTVLKIEPGTPKTEPGTPKTEPKFKERCKRIF
jgi:hypothetical protein